MFQLCKWFVWYKFGAWQHNFNWFKIKSAQIQEKTICRAWFFTENEKFKFKLKIQFKMAWRIQLNGIVYDDSTVPTLGTFKTALTRMIYAHISNGKQPIPKN